MELFYGFGTGRSSLYGAGLIADGKLRYITICFGTGRSSLYGAGLIADGKLRYITICSDSELIPDVSVCNTVITV